MLNEKNIMEPKHPKHDQLMFIYFEQKCLTYNSNKSHLFANVWHIYLFKLIKKIQLPKLHAYTIYVVIYLFSTGCSTTNIYWGCSEEGNHVCLVSVR